MVHGTKWYQIEYFTPRRSSAREPGAAGTADISENQKRFEIVHIWMCNKCGKISDLSKIWDLWTNVELSDPNVDKSIPLSGIASKSHFFHIWITQFHIWISQISDLWKFHTSTFGSVRSVRSFYFHTSTFGSKLTCGKWLICWFSSNIRRSRSSQKKRSHNKVDADPDIRAATEELTMEQLMRYREEGSEWHILLKMFP